MYKTIKVGAVLLCLASTNLSAQVYCASSVASPTADEDIYNVMVNGNVTNPLYSNSNGCSTAAPGPGSILGGYSNFKTLGTFATVIKGIANTFSVSEDECDGASYYPNGCAIWIDYNNDGDFYDSGEQIFVENSTTVSPRNIFGSFTPPLAAVSGTTVMRFIVAESVSGTGFDPCMNGYNAPTYNYGYGETEDYVINLVPPTPCAGTPASNSVVATTTLVCPVFGTASLSIANSYTLGGITYSWQSSTGSILGPYTNISGANGLAYTTPTLNATTYYQVAIGCANGGSTIAAVPVTIMVAATTTNSVPYFESFEGITQNNQLPNCSWTRTDNFQCSSRTSSLSNTRIARTGNKFGEFDASNYVYYNVRSYYSNGIQLFAGLTYSASVWYMTPGYPTWFNFSLLIGPNQSTTGQMNLATIGNPNNSVYQPLSSTFTVATSGLYYLCVRAQENYYGSQLVWDDLAIITPCSFASNGANINVTGPTQICAGQTANFNATGAGTYSWNTGATSSSLAVSPAFNTTYYITGTNPLTGCYSTLAKPLQVNQLPPVGIAVLKSDVCLGGSLNMFATSANSYTWSTGTQASAVSVTPAATTIYTVLGSDALGCVGSATQQIVVNPLPVIAIVPPSKTICMGEAANLTASGAAGATTYMWASNSLFVQGISVSPNPQATTTFTVSGTDANGCTGSANVVVTVEACVGIATVGASSKKAAIFPNPNSGDFTVELNNNLTKTIEVMDVRGRVVLSSTSDNNQVKVNISTLANGVYYVKVKSA
ncbi:MAG: GEVED domain-containing protein, partial [Bacteroidota bacterium]